MRFATSANPSARYNVIEPLFYNDEIVGVLDKGYVLGSVRRRSFTAASVQHRTSFKHPVLGTLVGLLMLVVPGQGLANDPLGLWWFVLGSCYGWPASLLLMFLGAYLRWGVVRRHDEPWIVFVT